MEEKDIKKLRELRRKLGGMEARMKKLEPCFEALEKNKKTYLGIK